MQDELMREQPFPDLLQGELVRRAKKQLRSRLKAVRRGFPAGALRARSEQIGAALLALPEVQRARAVALFWPMIERGEVDLRPVFHELRARDVRTFFPFMEPSETGYRTGFRAVEAEGDLEERGRGFVEPPLAQSAARGEIDVVIVPALAADSRGFRIGYGAGYYDATLGDICPPAVSVVVCYDFELMAELPVESHDVRCDVIATDGRTIRAV